MKLFILRHGDAETYASSDAKRQLTEQGRKNVTQTAQKYTKELCSVSNILVSPYVRAQQTADIVVASLSSENDEQASVLSVSTVDFITPDVPPQIAINKLFSMQEHMSGNNILLVSHQPLVGCLIDVFCNCKPDFMGGYAMSPASLACLEMDVVAAGCAELVFLHNS